MLQALYFLTHKGSPLRESLNYYFFYFQFEFPRLLAKREIIANALVYSMCLCVFSLITFLLALLCFDLQR